MRLTPSAFSRDAHPNEVTTRCGGRWAGLVVSHLVSLGFWGLAPLTDTWRTALSSWIRQSAWVHKSTCEISHMFAGGEGPWCRRGGVFTFSANVWIFLRKKNRHFTGHVIIQHQLPPCMLLKRREWAGDKADSELLGFGMTTCFIQEVLFLTVTGGKDEGKG